MMVHKKKAVKLYFPASPRLKDLALLTTLKVPILMTATHDLEQIPAAGRKVLEMKPMGCLPSVPPLQSPVRDKLGS